MSDYLHSIESASIDELQSLQVARLQETVGHAYSNSRYWKDKLDTHGVSPDDITSLDDLQKLPLMEKKDFRDNYPFSLFCVPREQVVRIHASSGTTGSPTVVGYTKEDIHDWATCVARSIFTAGGRPGDIIQVAYGYGLFTGGLGAHYGATELGCTVVPMSSGQTERQIKLLKDFGAKIIMVTPSYLMTIADTMKKLGVDPKKLPLKIGILGAEPWTLAYREQLEKATGIDALDIYGISEVIGPGIGQESVHNKGRTILWEDYFYPEVIDENGTPLPHGERGELVLTSLTKRALPVIRYRTRDLTTLYAPSDGRCMRSMDRITGRNDDMMIIKGVNVFPSQIEEQILSTSGLGCNYQIELTTKRNANHLIVHVDSDESGRNKEEAGQELSHKVKNYIGISIEVKIDHLSLPKSEGKAMRLIDSR